MSRRVLYKFGDHTFLAEIKAKQCRKKCNVGAARKSFVGFSQHVLFGSAYITQFGYAESLVRFRVIRSK
jgi:hypothetical protein